MGVRIISGYSTHLEIDAETHMTQATFVFPTPQDPDDFGQLMTRLASGIEVMIEVDDGEEDDD